MVNEVVESWEMYHFKGLVNKLCNKLLIFLNYAPKVLWNKIVPIMKAWSLLNIILRFSDYTYRKAQTGIKEKKSNAYR